MSLERYYRSFLKTPFENADLHQGGGGKRKHKVWGGMVNRFGAPLSGNANSKYLFGSPTGGTTGRTTPLVKDKYFVGGRKRKGKRSHRGGSSPYLQEFGQNGSIRTNSSSKLMDEFINPNTYHKTFPRIGTTIY